MRDHNSVRGWALRAWIPTSPTTGKPIWAGGAAASRLAAEIAIAAAVVRHGAYDPDQTTGYLLNRAADLFLLEEFERRDRVAADISSHSSVLGLVVHQEMLDRREDENGT